MTEPTAPAVLTELRDHVLVVTLNRPEARNAVNAALSQGLGEALERADHDPEIRVVVLTGAGDKSFCAGADLKAISRGESLNPPGTEQWGFAGFVNHPISKPVIAAVNATALGGGTELVLASDLVVAAESARFGLPEVKRGLMAAAGGLIRLPEQLPRKVAMHLILTGEPIDAETALRWGLVNEVVPDDRVLDAALDLAEVVAANAPLSVQASKRIALGLHDDKADSAADDTGPADLTREREAWRANNEEMVALMSTEDAIEGPTAFAEKRTPVWKAR
jgi:crotonobetainyl-CoA hydratase